ncbi:uncharacterized protein LOC128999087 [Macrosteles quadrilineatus]|uniref:uncharacterized protein LOC128999087 n=1 Tax=Macrosteles quadrilineatus TaxID=74068 RepID=UPI0023E302B3|nr:uncharacterized protein LOC128999087 [Macrosteles quadrilineatus]
MATSSSPVSTPELAEPMSMSARRRVAALKSLRHKETQEPMSMSARRRVAALKSLRHKETQAHPRFEMQYDAGEEDKPERVMVSVRAADYPEKAACHMCHVKFESSYNEEKDEWNLRNAADHEGNLVHPICLEDQKAAAEKLIVVEKIDITEDEPKEEVTKKEEESVEKKEKQATDIEYIKLVLPVEDLTVSDIEEEKETKDTTVIEDKELKKDEVKPLEEVTSTTTETKIIPQESKDDIQTHPCFEMQYDAGEEDKPERVMVSVRAADYPEKAACHMCHVKFESSYNEEKDKWNLRNAADHEGNLVHPICLEDQKAAAEKLIVVEEIDITEDEPKEEVTKKEEESVEKKEKQATDIEYIKLVLPVEDLTVSDNEEEKETKDTTVIEDKELKKDEVKRIKDEIQEPDIDMKWLFKFNVDWDVTEEQFWFLDEPIHNTLSLVNSLTEGLTLFHSLLNKIIIFKVLYDKDPIKAYSVIKTSDDCENQNVLVKTELELVDTARKMCHSLKRMMGIDDTNTLLGYRGPTPEWAVTYIKGSFYEHFGAKCCKRAAILFVKVLDDDQSPENQELLFLKARILGTVRYLEQWPGAKWIQEENLLNKLLSHQAEPGSSLEIRVKMYLAEFLRLRGYRNFLESVHLSGFYYRKATSLLLSLIEPLKLWRPEASAWLAEQLFIIPSDGEWMWMEEAQEVLRKISTVSQSTAYTFRTMALSMELQIRQEMKDEMRWAQQRREKVQKPNMDQEGVEMVISVLDHAIKLGSAKAKLEKAGFLCRAGFDECTILKEFTDTPDAPLHKAAHLMLCRNKQSQAQELLKPYLTPNMIHYPALMAFHPFCTLLMEPVNVRDVVQCQPSAQPTQRSSTQYLTVRKDILAESIRLRTNKSCLNKNRRHKKNK